MAKARPTRSCKCGNEIYPYIINEKEYWATLCPACIDKQDDEEAKQKALDNLVHLGLQRRYMDSDFDNLHDPKPSEAILEAIKGYASEIAVQHNASGRGLYLWGPNGTGKTHLAAAVAKRVQEALFVNTLHLFDELKESYKTNEVCRIFESARYVHLLVLDDLGSERPTGWVQERLYALINTRWDEMLPTVYTSNHSPKELEDIIGTRSSSRVLGSCLTIHIDGPDHRRYACAAL